MAAVVHMEEEVIIRLNDTASELDVEMTAIRVALENAITMSKHTMTHHNKQKTTQTKDHRRLQQTDSSMRTLMSMPRKVHRSIWRRNIEMSNILTSDNRTTTEIR